MDISVGKIELAAKRLRGIIHHTMLQSSRTFSDMCGGQIYLKYENQQKTGSFKIRGAYNKIASLKEGGNAPEAVIAASAGNHAQGVAYAATALSIKSTIVMPRSTPIVKVSATEGYGANVVLHGDGYDDAYKKAMELRDESDGVFIHPFDDIDVIAGQGTVGLEILQDLSTVDTVVIPAGGGGLLAGVAFCIKSINPRVRIVGVQSQGADAICRSFREKRAVTTDRASTIADGIAVKEPGEITRELIGKYVDDMVTVNDAEIAAAILSLLERDKNIVEPAGAVAVAAALNGKTDVIGRRVVCVLSGGNIDVGFINRIIEKGLVSRGRRLRFRTTMLDKPGSLEFLSGIVSSANANIIMVQYDPSNADIDITEAIIHIACEVSGEAHGKAVVTALENAGYKIQME